MSDSNITKNALAAALKQLMLEAPFNKISVGDICERCHLNRKSFYYHFKDKYDLVNWIFTTEFLAEVSKAGCDTAEDMLLAVCRYLDANRVFYRRALEIRGQNSLYEYFREDIEPLANEYASEHIADRESRDFFVTFYCDAFMAAIERWVFDPKPLSPDRFVKLLSTCMRGLENVVSPEDGKG